MSILDTMTFGRSSSASGPMSARRTGDPGGTSARGALHDWATEQLARAEAQQERGPQRAGADLAVAIDRALCLGRAWDVEQLFKRMSPDRLHPDVVCAALIGTWSGRERLVPLVRIARDELLERALISFRERWGWSPERVEKARRRYS